MTRRLVGDLFELEDLGAQELKGFPGAMRCAPSSHCARAEPCCGEVFWHAGIVLFVAIRHPGKSAADDYDALALRASTTTAASSGRVSASIALIS
jgi:hypothetical protein